MKHQVNLIGLEAQKVYKFLFSFGGWILLFLVLWFKGCGSGESKNPTTKVTIPAITKVFPVDTIIEHKVVEVKKMVQG